MSAAKHYCLTLNNPTDDDVARWNASFTEASSDIKYVVYGREVGESGTPHLQGYVHFGSRHRLTHVKRVFGSRVHAEITRGKPKQASDYCKKDGKYMEFGELPTGQGKRSDLASALLAIKSGSTRRDLIENHAVAYSRAYRVLNDAQTIFAPQRDWRPSVFVLYGETGTGKTKYAFNEAPASYFHPGGLWFDGYDGQPDVIFDDFGGSEFKLTYLLKLLDRYPMRVPVKGSFVSWVPKRIFITSNYSPKEWYPNAKDEHVKALFRRFEKVTYYRRFASVQVTGGFEADEYVTL